eukprot:EG_transcript_59551
MAEFADYAVGDPLLVTRSVAPFMYTAEPFGPHHMSIHPVQLCGPPPRVIRLVPLLLLLLLAAGLGLLIRAVFPFQQLRLFVPLSPVPHAARVPRLVLLSPAFPSLP